MASDEDYSSVDNLSLQNMKTDESAHNTSQDIHMHHEVCTTFFVLAVLLLFRLSHEDYCTDVIKVFF